MRLVLLKDVKGIGRVGELKNVSDGYARNFLIPNKLAQKATEKNIKRAEETVAQEKSNEEAVLKKVTEIAKKLEGKEFVFTVKVQASSEKLFGSIDRKQISEKLVSEKFEIVAENIFLAKPIKKLGNYPVKIGFTTDIFATITIVVEKE